MPANPPSWPIVTYATILNGAANSSPFNVPEGINSMTIITPQMTSATFKLQSLDPSDGATWRDTWTTSTSAATPAIAFQLSAFPCQSAGGAAQVFPYNMIGGGPLRIVTSGNETGNKTISILFDRAA